MPVNKHRFPLTHSVRWGERTVDPNNSLDPRYCYARKQSVNGTVYGIVRNTGKTAFTFSVAYADPADYDTLTTKNIRVGGTSVASVTVNPGGSVVFTIDLTSADDKDVMVFSAVPSSGADLGHPSGEVVVSTFDGQFDPDEYVAPAGG